MDHAFSTTHPDLTLTLPSQLCKFLQNLLLPLNLAFQFLDLFFLLLNTPLHICQSAQLGQRLSDPAFQKLRRYSCVLVFQLLRGGGW